MSSKPVIAGVILAAGRATRMGGDKLHCALAGRQLLDHVAQRLAPQVQMMALNSAQQVEGFLCFPDCLPGFRGPLVGLLSALREPQLAAATHIALVPCDGPFLPDNLVSSLLQAMQAAETPVAMASFSGQLQPTFSLWRRDVSDTVAREAIEKGFGGLRYIASELGYAQVAWPDTQLPPFYNINCPPELAVAEQLLLEAQTTCR